MEPISAAARVTQLDTQPSPEALMQLGFGFWASKAFLSAVELGLFTELAKGPADAAALTERLGIHERAARDFFDALVALKVLDRQDGVYANTPETDLFLDRAKPSYVGGILEMCSTRLYTAWGGLAQSLQTGLAYKMDEQDDDAFEKLYADQAGLEQFLRAMTGISLPVAMSLAQKFPWREYQSFADLGCAQGGLPAAVARAHRHLTGFGFDLPAVEPIFSAYIREHGLSDRLRFRGGSFFEDPLPTADVYVYGHILHDWGLEQKRLLLRRAFEALPRGGAVVVIDTMIDDERREHVTGLLMSLNMLVETPTGFDYTGADCLGWLAEAGFRDCYVEPLTSSHSMAVGRK